MQYYWVTAQTEYSTDILFRKRADLEELMPRRCPGFPSLDRTRRLVEHLASFPLLTLHRGDYVYAAEIRNKCRAKGLAVSTIDAQIAGRGHQSPLQAPHPRPRLHGHGPPLPTALRLIPGDWSR